MRRAMLAGLVVVTACSQSASKDAAVVSPAVSEDRAPAMEAAAAPMGDMAQKATVAGAVPAPAAATPGPVAADRMIIRRAQLSLQVSDVRRAVQQVTDATNRAKGFLGESRMWRDGEADRATMTLRVPSAALDSTLGALRTLAVRVDDESVSGEDVTRQAVDLTAQLTNLRATEAELRALLTTVRQRSQKASDILEVHAELSRVRGEIDQHAGELQALSQLAALSTITLDLRPDVGTAPVATDAWQPRGVVRDAVRALVGTTRTVVNAAIWLVIYVGPMLVVAGLALLGVRNLWRRRRVAVAS